MADISVHGADYRAIIGSDTQRDGMFLEVGLENQPAHPSLEIFYSDQSHRMTVSLFEHDVPLDLLDWSIELARKRLPPLDRR